LKNKIIPFNHSGKIIIFLTLFIFNFLPLEDISACTYTLDTPYITSIFPTENEEIYIIEIQSNRSSIEFFMILNSSDMTLSTEPLVGKVTDVTPVISISPFQSTVIMYEDQINWLVRDSENNSIINMTFQTNFEVLKCWTFENLKLNRTYLIIGDLKDYYVQTQLYSIYLNGTDFRNETLPWYVYSDEWAPYVYEEEGLLFAPGPSGMCISGYYYRFNQTGSISLFKTCYTYMKILIDTRSQTLLSLDKLANRIEIRSYNLSIQIPTKSKEFSRSWLYGFLNNSDATDIFREVTTGFLGIGTLISVSSLYVVFVRKKKRKFQ